MIPTRLLRYRQTKKSWKSALFLWQRIQKWIRTFFNFRQGELNSILLVVQIKYCIIVIQNNCVNKIIYQRFTLIMVSQICYLWPFKKFLVLFISVFRFFNLLLCDFYFNIFFLSLKLLYCTRNTARFLITHNGWKPDIIEIAEKVEGRFVDSITPLLEHDQIILEYTELLQDSVR